MNIEEFENFFGHKIYHGEKSQLRCWAAGLLHKDRGAILEQHLKFCRKCRQLTHDIAGDNLVHANREFLRNCDIEEDFSIAAHVLRMDGDRVTLGIWDRQGYYTECLFDHKDLRIDDGGIEMRVGDQLSIIFTSSAHISGRVLRQDLTKALSPQQIEFIKSRGLGELLAQQGRTLPQFEADLADFEAEKRLLTDVFLKQLSQNPNYANYDAAVGVIAQEVSMSPAMIEEEYRDFLETTRE